MYDIHQSLGACLESWLLVQVYLLRMDRQLLMFRVAMISNCRVFNLPLTVYSRILKLPKFSALKPSDLACPAVSSTAFNPPPLHVIHTSIFQNSFPAMTKER